MVVVMMLMLDECCLCCMVVCTCGCVRTLSLCFRVALLLLLLLLLLIVAFVLLLLLLLLLQPTIDLVAVQSVVARVWCDFSGTTSQPEPTTMNMPFLVVFLVVTLTATDTSITCSGRCSLSITCCSSDSIISHNSAYISILMYNIFVIFSPVCTPLLARLSSTVC